MKGVLGRGCELGLLEALGLALTVAMFQARPLWPGAAKGGGHCPLDPDPGLQPPGSLGPLWNIA